MNNDERFILRMAEKGINIYGNLFQQIALEFCNKGCVTIEWDVEDNRRFMKVLLTDKGRDLLEWELAMEALAK
jgi:hypothetical protein